MKTIKEILTYMFLNTGVFYWISAIWKLIEISNNEPTTTSKADTFMALVLSTIITFWLLKEKD